MNSSRRTPTAAAVALSLLWGLASCRPEPRPSPSLASFAAAGMTVDVEVRSGPVREGKNELEIAIRDASGGPVDDAAVRLQYAMSMAGAPSMTGAAAGVALGGGRYRAEVGLEMSGTWQVTLSARRPSGAEARAQGMLRTGAPGIELQQSLAGAEAAPAAPAESAGGTVRADPVRLQKVGVRFARVERAELVRTVRALGRVTWDETRLVDVAPKIGGFVRDLRADALGMRVARGDPLFSVYSPDLYAAQVEYLQARAGGRAELTAAARARLRLWDVSDRDVAALERRGAPFEALPVRAPASGFLLEKNVVEGAAFEAGARLFRIAPLEQIWVEAEVWVSDLPSVSVGQAARVSSPALPGHALDARVAYVLPSLASETRTARIRLELGNGDLALRPGMFVDVDLRAELGPRLLVPLSAVVVAGERRIVFVERAPGELQPRVVETGAASEDAIEITRGLEQGERIVVSGNFLIAAESRVQSLLEPR